MNKQEYKDYEEAVTNFFETEKINCLTTGSAEDIGSTCDRCGEYNYPETYFSFNGCDCCGTTLAGDRYHAEGYCPDTNEIYCYEVCPGCLYYAEYGQLDDMTMMDIEE